MDYFRKPNFSGSCGGENTGEDILQSHLHGSSNSNSNYEQPTACNGEECLLPQASIVSNADLEKVEKKRQRDKEYRERRKKEKDQMSQNLVTLAKENEDLKIENKYLKETNAFMNQRLQSQTEELNDLKIHLDNLKLENEKQNALVQILSDRVANLNLCLENTKLKDENAQLREIVKVSDGSLKLVEDNAKLQRENKLLKVQIDALCGTIIDANRKNCEHK